MDSFNLGRLLQSSVDTVTNPQTYIRLGNQATEVLSRQLPQRFQGAGFQNLPAQFTGALDDISQMMPGAEREAARDNLKRQMQRAGLAQQGTNARPSGQGPGGALRAPTVGNTGGSRPVMTSAPSTQLPQAGGPLAADPALRRTSGAAAELNTLRGRNRGRIPKDFSQPGQPKSGAPVPRPSNPKNPIVGPRSIRPSGGLPNFGINNLLKSLKGVGAATGIELGLMGLDTTLRSTNPTFAAKRNIADAYTAKYGPNYSLTPQEMAAKLAETGDIDPLTMRQLYGGSGDMDAGIDSIKTAPATLNGIAGIVDVNPQTGKGISETFRRGDMDAGDSATYTPQDGYVFDSDVAPPATIPPPPPSNNVPASSAEQTMMDPYAYNLAVYGQGRQLATTRDERAAVRDLGLAINRSLYPKLNKTQDINPLLQATFPERTNDTLTGNINSRGTTLPGSMTEADSGSELATAQLQDTPYQATFRLGMMQGQEADERINVLNDATTLVEKLMGQAQTDEIRRRLEM